MSLDLSGIELTVDGVIEVATRLALEVKKDTKLTKDQKVAMVQNALRTSVAAKPDLDKGVAEDIEKAIVDVVPGLVGTTKESVFARFVQSVFSILELCRFAVSVSVESDAITDLEKETTVPAVDSVVAEAAAVVDAVVAAALEAAVPAVEAVAAVVEAAAVEAVAAVVEAAAVEAVAESTVA